VDHRDSIHLLYLIKACTNCCLNQKSIARVAHSFVETALGSLDFNQHLAIFEILKQGN